MGEVVEQCETDGGNIPDLPPSPSQARGLPP